MQKDDDFAAWRHRHAGETVLVAGCGESLALLPAKPSCTVIGVNDVGRAWHPDYLVVVNPASQFAPGRWAAVQATQARAVFTQLAEPGLPAAVPVVRFRLGQRAGTNDPGPDALHYTRNSPYVAVQLALHLGARRIGLIGVDFTDRHFFADTGPHALARRLPQIDAEYAALHDACAARGVTLVNLSPVSRLQALPKWRWEDFMRDAAPAPETAPDPAPLPPRRSRPTRVLFVQYRFLSCGEVFVDGLARAATTLGLDHRSLYWDDPGLEAELQRFEPDLLLAVHGRRFAPRWAAWRARFPRVKSAVWLVDEPYEVDDTAAWSQHFDAQFLNDPATLRRHPNAHALPTCHDPQVHHAQGVATRPHGVVFVGGANPAREAVLLALEEAGLLDVLIGGPWRAPALRARAAAATVPATQTAGLYRRARIVLNVFREVHHFNRQSEPATAMNPRIHEALACGALVISEPRDEITARLPELPTFTTPAEAVAQVRRWSADPAAAAALQRGCAERLAGEHYAARLGTVLRALGLGASVSAEAAPLPNPAPTPAPNPAPNLAPWAPEGWLADAAVATEQGAQGAWRLWHAAAAGPAAERGLRRTAAADAELCIEVRREPGATLVAKVRAQQGGDARADSYHLLARDGEAYLARQRQVLHRLPVLAAGRWYALRLRAQGAALSVWIDGQLVAMAHDARLTQGHAFVGVQGGALELRALELQPLAAGADATGGLAAPNAADGAIGHLAIACPPPRLSIVTTVYDRVDCLARCIDSVQALHEADWEHLIVCDAAPPAVVNRIEQLVRRSADPRRGFWCLDRRHNDWGIAPAAAGLRRSRGRYLAFLSDDNGYHPDHFAPLIDRLERRPELGFVYSSCHYAGRRVLRHPVPAPARIDLGQPLFRRELFRHHLGDTLPFAEMAWDWRMIERLLQAGVRWEHIDQASFVFRLAEYPQWWAQGQLARAAAD
ncbi:MAG: glycosyltransferase [Rubrivivax sp.]|nr:glycosyltransferase [Rubrivivax sp.]